MNRFQFTARNPDGQHVTGEIFAADSDTATRRLQGAGVYVTSIVSLGPVRRLPSPHRVSLSAQERLFLLKSMAMFLESGIPIQSALLRLKMSTSNASLRLALDRIQNAIDDGATLTQAIQMGRIFPPSWAAVLMTSEKHGDFVRPLQMLRQLASETDRFKRQLLGLFIMPALLLALVTFWLWLFLVRVVPSLSLLIEQIGGPPSLSLTMRLAAQEILVTIQIGFCLFGAGFLLSRWTRRADREMGILQSWVPLWFPVVGSLTAQLHLIFIASGLHLQLEAGIPAVQAVETLSRSISHRTIRQDLLRAARELKRGAPIPEALGYIRIIPHMGRALFSVGNLTGKLPELLEFIVRETKADLMERIKRLAVWIRTFVTLVSGVLVGLLVILFFKLLFSSLSGFGQAFYSRPAL